MKKEGNGDNSFGVSSVSLSIIGIIISLLIIPSVLLGIVGLVFGIIQLRKSNNSWAKWGIALSILSIIAGILFFYLYLGLIEGFNDLVAQCALNPTLPQCDEIAKVLPSP